MALSKKIIVVVGATGNQGSSVAHTFLKLPNWHVRCLTRNPSTSASQTLASLGAEVIKADLTDASSLPQAFANANAVFLNTDFWEVFRAPETAGNSEAAFANEVLCGKNAVVAAAAVPSLERLVYSALPPMKKHSKGKYASYHWEAKATVVEYIMTEQPELAKKTSFIYLGAYNTNALLSPRANPANGGYIFSVPLSKATRIPIIDPNESTGLFVQALIEEEDAGVTLLAYDSYLSMGEIADVWSKASGKEAGYVEVDPEVIHKKFGISKEILDAPAFINEFGYLGGVERFIEPFQLKKKVQTKPTEEWLKERDWKTVLEALNAAKAQ